MVWLKHFKEEILTAEQNAGAFGSKRMLRRRRSK